VDRPTPEEAAARKAALIVALKREYRAWMHKRFGTGPGPFTRPFKTLKQRRAATRRLDAMGIRIAALEAES
jgi:hypothetical protein